MAETRIRVKVCGITQRSDAMDLESLGVDYLGFNFFPGSKRFIQPVVAAEIIFGLKRAEPVGVFVDATLEQIQNIVALTGIKRIQMHGKEGWNEIAASPLPLIKAIPHTKLTDLGGLKSEWEKRASPTHPEFFLVDTQTQGAFGGTGLSFDWALLQRHPLPRPIFLAGGLGPDNVAEAVRLANPFAVDLNSKVELSPGKKSVELVARCLGVLRTRCSSLSDSDELFFAYRFVVAFAVL